MAVVDIAKYQGESISEVIEEGAKENDKIEELRELARNKLKKEHPDIFLGSIFDPNTQEMAHEYISQYVREWVKEKGLIKEYGTIDKIVEVVFNKIMNLGILRKIIEMGGVTDIFQDSPSKIYYELKGEKVYLPADEAMKTNEEMLLVMKRLASAKGEPLNAEQPVVNAQIGKNRFNLVLGRSEKGLASDHSITIRVHRLEQFKAQELIDAGQITQEAVDFLTDMAGCKEIGGMFFGPTGSGKTTSLDTFIIANIPKDERIVVIEDEPELRSREKYPDKNILELITKEGKSEESSYTIARLVEEVALRAKPDRVFIGEIRKGIHGDKFLYAASTGHPGWSSGHAKSARTSIRRIAKMVQSTRPNADVKDIEEEIYSLLDIIVYINIIKINGKKIRKVTDIVELYQDLEGRNEYRQIFKYSRQNGLIRVNAISKELAQKLEDQEIDPSRWLKVGD